MIDRLVWLSINPPHLLSPSKMATVDDCDVTMDPEMEILSDEELERYVAENVQQMLHIRFKIVLVPLSCCYNLGLASVGLLLLCVTR